MRKLSFLKSAISFVLLFTMSILLVSCSSGSDNDDVPSNANTFNVADFALTVTSKKLIGSDWLEIDYSVKNTSKISYTKYEQGNFTVKFTAKTTDGEIFQSTRYVEYVEAGVTYTDNVHLKYTVGKTLDVSTLTAVIVKD